MKFFHTSLILRRRRNIILLIKDGSNWIEDKKGIRDYFENNFKELF